LIDGVQHCHSQSVSHRDLKPEKILLDITEELRFGRFRFGYAGEESSRRWNWGHSQQYCTRHVSCRSCSILHSPPDYDTRSVDIRFLDIILINMICGIELVPWLSAQNSDEHFSRYLRDPARIRLYLLISWMFLPLLIRILDPNPGTRISLSEGGTEGSPLPRG
ncbi:hypothetical protein K488DRAFT_61487, partial [Vararia minispora EC-137]